ncbi:hypothetical protein ACHAW5_002957 [Stephanodiscus triporus]|uniref:Uncharacterized protein n=1 Tax=Stephanodiscus triporus TaxID=2934178 RepID=A0ABD3PHL8_9STRA
MVHFVRNVGRPLEMVVARDGNFVPSPAETTTIGMDVDDARQEEAEAEVEVEGEGGGIFDNACFSLRADEICNLPCPGAGGVVLCGVKIPLPSPIQLHPPAAVEGGDGGPAASSPSSSPSSRKAHPWDRYEQGEGRDDEDDDNDDNYSVYAASVVEIGASAPAVVPEGMISTTKTADDEVEGCGGRAPSSPPVVDAAASWPARVDRADGGTTRPTGSPTPADDAQHGRSAYMPLFPRTHPKIISSEPSQHQPKQGGDVRPAGSDKLTVAQLRAKFSPIRNHGTPAASMPGPVQVAEEDAAKLRGLYSPMVVPESSADAAYRPDDPPESRESASPVVPEGSESTMMSDGHALDVRQDPAKMSPRHKREELARTIVKGKRGWGDARKIRDDRPTNPQAPDPEPSPTRPFDEPSSESRDDTHHRHGKIPPETNNGAAKALLAKSEKKNHLPSGWAHEQVPNLDLSPTGSTISVENDKTPSKEKSFGEGPFQAPDGDADSPFVGDIKFATPNQRVPSSTLFSQAFLVQPNPAGEGPVNVRWVQTNSPLFVTRKTNDSTSLRTRPPDSDDLLLDPNAKTFNASAFDLPQLDWNEGKKSLADADQNPSSELNETIVYADSMEAARVDCCSISELLDGFAQNCGINSNSPWQAMETANNVPSPRRKNILSKIRKKKKKNLEYGNLVDDDMKGIRKARVQLAYQNIRGKTTAKASQFALLVDDEICF